jgi:hypothetical protein
MEKRPPVPAPTRGRPPRGRAIPGMPPPPKSGARVKPANAAPSAGGRSRGSAGGAPAARPVGEAGGEASGATPEPGSTRAILLQANQALQLRDEQLRAEVQYYNASLPTNAELDAITAQVVAELQDLARVQLGSGASADVENELTESLRELLEKLFSKKRSGFLTRKLEDVQRRITQLFFNSELYARLAESSSELPAATWPEQVLYFAIKRHEEMILGEIAAMPVAEPEVRERAIEKLAVYTRSLCTDFLSKTTPELERLLAIYKEALTHFFLEVLPAGLGELCRQVVRESRIAEGHDLGYKITADKFHPFRVVFDRKFLEHLVLNVQGPITQRATETGDQFRDATLRFIQDPRIHMEICTAVNDAVYDYLHGEGYLDLPPDWRRIFEQR